MDARRVGSGLPRAFAAEVIISPRMHLCKQNSGLAHYLLVSPYPTLRKGFLQPLHQSGRGGSGDKSSHLQTVDDTSEVQEVSLCP